MSPNNILNSFQAADRQEKKRSMNRAGRIIAVCGLSMALMMPQAAYAAETLSVQVSERTGLTTVGNKQSAYDNVAISHVSNYVNIRSEANTSSSIVGKIYNNCAATILATVDGEGGTWYQIKSGTVTGYIKSEYFITGADAEKIAKNVGTVYVTVSADSLRLREQPSTDSAVLTTLSKDAEYLEVKEEGDFIEIQVDESLSGYVHKDYVTQRVEFKQAVSVEEERQKAEEDARIKKEAEDAIAKVEALKKEAGQGTASANKDTPSTSIGMIAQNPNADNGTTKEQNNQSSQIGASQNTGSQDTGSTAGPGGSETSTGSSTGTSGTYQNTQTGPGSAVYNSAVRTAIVAYAKQFLGNPYVYGGTSLTNGADCSGFTMRIFEHFGVTTGRTSRDQAANGREISLDQIQPGDLLFYASGKTINHVALYIGDGKIIHASTSKTGIIISTAYYRTPAKAVTFLD